MSLNTPIPDLYQVKWFHGYWRYGIVDRWSDASIQYYEDGQQVIITDAIMPVHHVINVDALVPIDMTYNPPDEYTAFVEEQYRIAKGRSDSLPEGLHPGKLFRVPRGDGYAFYVVIKVNKKTVDIEWRGYGLDRWVDDRFGYGGRQKREDVELFVRREDGMRRLLGERREVTT
jgi:hypothetical protein